MISLREQLKQLLPEILPADPREAIKGTELIDLVKGRLSQDYSDATLRYHFSIMSCDPSSPIAKVDQGQGYYLRTNTLSAMTNARHLVSAAQASFGGEDSVDPNQALLRASKFRSIVSQLYTEEKRFPYALDETFSENAKYADLWSYPDMVVIDWDLGSQDDRAVASLDDSMIRLGQRFGAQPFMLRSVKLKLSINENTFREDFYQCLSNSRWAHYGEFVVAEPIENEAIRAELSALGAEFGIGVSSLGIDAQTLDELPEPGMLGKSTNGETPWSNSIQVQQIAAPRARKELDWVTIRGLRKSNDEIESLFRWISHCLDSSSLISFEEFSKIAPTLPATTDEMKQRELEHAGAVAKN